MAGAVHQLGPIDLMGPDGLGLATEEQLKAMTIGGFGYIWFCLLNTRLFPRLLYEYMILLHLTTAAPASCLILP